MKRHVSCDVMPYLVEALILGDSWACFSCRTTSSCVLPSHLFSRFHTDCQQLSSSPFPLTLYSAKAIIVSHPIIWRWYTGCWCVDCDIRYSEEGTGRRPQPAQLLLAVPNVTVYPSTARLPITVLLYYGPFCCLQF